MTTRIVSVKPTITAGAYSAGDVVGGLLEFEDAISKFSQYAEIVGLVIVDDAGQDAAIDLAIFDQEFTPIADNGPWDPSEGDQENCLGHIPVAAADYLDGASNSVGRAKASVLPHPIVMQEAETSIWGQLVTSGTPTYVATDDLTVKLIVRQ